MNILIVNYEFPPLGGGGGIFTRDMAIEFAREHDVTVLTSHFEGIERNENIEGINVYRVPVLNRNSLYAATMTSMLSYPPMGTLKGIDILRRKKYDIINTHFAVPSGPCGALLSHLFNIPNVLSIHGSDIYNPTKKTSPHKHAFFRWGVRTCLRDASEVIAQSTHIKNYAEKIYKPGRDISIIPLGMPFPEFTKADRTELSMIDGKFYLISIGRMDDVKGYSYLIKSVEILRKKGHDIYLTLLGDGNERANLERLTRDLGLSDYIKFPGWISGKKKFHYLEASDLYVMSSIHEGFGVVLLEAMYCGLPVVATNIGGQTDIIKDPENGLLVGPGDEKALAETILKLYSSAETRDKMSVTNKEYIKNFNISHVAKRYIDLFRNVIKNNKK